VPDLLLLQEVHGEKEASGIAKSLGLNYYVYSNYSPAKAGDGLAIISRYPLFDPDIYYIKACGYALFSTGMVVKGQPFLVCSVHLARIRSFAFSKVKDIVELPWKRAFELLQTELTQETPRTRAVDELLTWLDFNTVPFSTAIRKIGRIYNDALWPTTGYLTGSYTKLSLSIKPRIDYIFYSPDIKCSSASIVKQGAGDHYPVLAVFELFDGKT
jgi:endonuclease/exonuclease/phosphatase family metal-dependent hydrolase